MTNITTIKPSYIFCYWKPWEEDTSTFQSFQDYKKDISLSNYLSHSIGKFINHASKEQIVAISELWEKIGIALNKNLKCFEYNSSILNSRLSNINYNLNHLNTNISSLIDQQKVANLLLQDICDLLRVPDSEKERKSNISLGLKFYVKAIDDSDLYDDALEFLLKAESLLHQDSFVLHRIGLIYLNSHKHFNPQIALEYFIKAAKYSIIEDTLTAKNLVEKFYNVDISYLQDNEKFNALGVLASESYNKAAFVSYIMGDFNNAIILQQKAVSNFSSFENYFMLAKYQARNMLIEKCLESLRLSFEKYQEGIYMVFHDIDLINEKAVLNFLDDQLIKNNINEELLNNNIKRLSEKLSNSEVPTIVSIVEQLNQVSNLDFSSKLKLYKDSKLADIDNWSFENLDITHYNNGDEIHSVSTKVEWLKLAQFKQPGCFQTSDITSDASKFGKLYNWYAISDIRGIAFNGWHVPNNKEFRMLNKILKEELIIIENAVNKIIDKRRKKEGYISISDQSSIRKDLFRDIINKKYKHFFLYKINKLIDYVCSIGSSGQFYMKKEDEINWWSITEVNKDDAYLFSFKHQIKSPLEKLLHCCDFDDDLLKDSDFPIIFLEAEKVAGYQVILIKDS